jgi:hypothetical protein
MAAVTKNRNFSNCPLLLLAEKISQKNPEYVKLLLAM